MSRFKLALSGIGLLVISGSVSFAVVALLYTPGAAASIDNSEEARSWDASSVQEAETIAGYPIASPGFLPPGVVPGKNILVNQPAFPNLPKFVQRFWNSPGDPSVVLMLEQHPGLGGLGNGEPTPINGISGEMELVPPSPPGRPLPMLKLFWREGEVSYVLTGTLNGPLTKEVLLKIASSVRLP